MSAQLSLFSSAAEREAPRSTVLKSIATWNINSLGKRLDALLRWAQRSKVDVMCLQETRLSDGDFPFERFSAAGYSAAVHGEGGRNGVAILSRLGVSDVDRASCLGARYLSCRVGSARVICLYAPFVQRLDARAAEARAVWDQETLNRIGCEQRQHGTLLICADLNLIASPLDIDPSHLNRFGNLASGPYRNTYRALLSLGLTDVDRTLHPRAPRYTWFGPTEADVQARRGMRLDAVLASTALMERVVSSTADEAVRDEPGSSDHVPVVVHFAG